MGKLKSSFKNMVLALGGVSIFAAGTLGLVQELTKEPIMLSELANQEAAIKEVVPDFDNNPIDEQYMLPTTDGDSLLCFPGKKDGKLVGLAIRTYSNKGFSGLVEIMVGLKPDGEIFNYSVLEQKETPGLGAKMVDWFKTDKNNQSVIGMNPGKNKVWVSKDGGEVDAITAATISSRAFLDAIDRAYRSYMASEDIDIDARTGASAQKKVETHEDEVSGITEKQTVVPEKKTEVRKVTSKPKIEAKQKTKTAIEEKKSTEEVDAQTSASSDYSTEEGETK